MLPKHIDNLKPAPYNNELRTISERSAEGLTSSVENFGDISGVVWNQRTGHLVAGHQRVDALRKLGGELVGDDDGSMGIVVRKQDGTEHVFGVRVVDWAEDKEKAASIAANNQHLAGEFTDGLLDALGEMQTDLGEGFQAMNFDMLLNNIPTTLDPQGTNPTDEWEGMPEFVSDDNTSYRKIIVHFQSEEKVQEFAKLVAQQVTLRTKFLHFPRKEREERQWIGSEDEEPTT